MPNFVSKMRIDGVDAYIKDSSLTTALNTEITDRQNADLQIGEEINDVNDRIDEIESRIMENASALLTCIGYKTTVADTSDHPGNAFNIIQTKSGKTIIVDCGWEYTEATCRSIFDGLGIDSVDILVITHYHGDHVGNLANILNILDVSNMTAYIPSAPSADWADGAIRSRYDTIYALLNAAGVDIVYPIDRTYEVDNSISLTFRNCANDGYYLTLGSDTNTYNNTSRCCYVTVDDTSILFTGDLEIYGAERVAPDMIGASLAQMPHHGYGRDYSDEFYKNIMAGAWFVNNANGDGGDGNVIPRIWNNIYVQATKENKPVFCTSISPDRDLVLLIGGLITSTNSAAYHENEESFGKGRYTNLSLATKTGYAEVIAGSYKDIIKKMPGNSEVYAITTAKAQPVPENAMSYIINVSNSGSYQDTFGNQRYAINQWQKYNGGASGRVISHYYDSSDEITNFIQNTSVGNCYRFGVSNLASGGSATPNLETNHGSDIDAANATLRRNLAICLVVIQVNFSANPSGGDIIIKSGGNTEDSIYLVPNVRYQNVCRILTNLDAGALTVENAAGATMSTVKLTLIPIAYDVINEASWPLS